MMEAEITQIPGWRPCDATNTIRHGYTTKGKQRYRCRTCSSRSFVQDPASAAYDPARKEEILRAYHERASLRGISRIFGLSRNTLTPWLKKAEELLPLKQTLAPAAAQGEILELVSCGRWCIGARTNGGSGLRCADELAKSSLMLSAVVAKRVGACFGSAFPRARVEEYSTAT